MFAITEFHNPPNPIVVNGLMRCSKRRGRGSGRNKNSPWSSSDSFKGPKGKLQQDSQFLDPVKVYVTNMAKDVSKENLHKYLSAFANVVDVIIIRKKNDYNKVIQYGFVELATEEDTQKMLRLSKEARYFRGSYMSFRPARQCFKLPGMFGYKRIIPSDRDFDLEPADPDKPSIHMLIDDVLLKILEYLPLKNLIKVESVCRRWQSLVHFSFRRKACHEIKGDLNAWLSENALPLTLPAISKVLILCGETMKELTIGDDALMNLNGKLLRIIGQLCPVLESLTVTGYFHISDHFLKELVSSCPNLKSLSFKDHSNFNENHLGYILSNLPLLESLHLEAAEIHGLCFNSLPETLKYLCIPRCIYVIPELVSLIPMRCPLLKVLRLDGIGISPSLINEIGKSCPDLNELGVEVAGEGSKADMKELVNLKKLSFLGRKYSLTSIINALPDLEELLVDGLILETPQQFIDFSIMKNLRVLILPNRSFTLNLSSLKSISFCSHLRKFKFKGTSEDKPGIIEIIRRCPSLEELDCPSVTLNEDDIESFVEANKKRDHRLKFVIGLDRGAMEQIEKLSESKYDVNMFDSHNLFSDLNFLDEFEDLLDYSDDSLDSSDYLYDAADDLDLIHDLSYPGGFYMYPEFAGVYEYY